MSRSLLLTLVLASFSFAADKPEYAQPDPSSAAEPLRKVWSAEKAASYLDAVGVNWTRDRKCVTCHTNMPYLMARPKLSGHGDDGWKEVRKFLDDDVTSWSAGGKPKGDAYVVVTAAALAASDARTGKLSDTTKAALDRMWTVQQKSGAWNWIKCDWPPLEHDDYYGATLAAVAVGLAPEKYAETENAKAGIAKLKGYFAATPVPDLHHKLMLAWAASMTDGLMSADEKKAVVAEVRKRQHADGGWCLPSFGQYKRRDQQKTPNDPKADSDGYATGLAVFVLRQSGVPTDDEAVAKGVGWLKANQRESGRWFTRSLNNDKDHYITHAGTAFAVMALDACGQLKR
jgi:squalene-hopene/tetraprenyl-beta-curcumene cyclase